MPKTAYDTREAAQRYGAEDISEHKEQSAYLKTAGICFIGFCFSGLDTFDGLSPFSVGFLSVVPFEYCLPVFIGSSLGYLLTLPVMSALKYVVALGITAFFRLFLHRRFRNIEGGTANYIIALCSVLCSGLVFMLFTRFSLKPFLMLCLEAVLAMCSSVFFLRASKSPVRNTGISGLNVKDTVSLGISLCLFLMCLSGFTVEGISPARIPAAMLVMFAAVYKGVPAGAICGICVGASLCIDPDYRHLFPAYALGGLAAGVFSPFGQVGVALAFSVCYCACSVISGLDNALIISLVELGISFAAFLIVPAKYISALQDFLHKKGMITDTRINKQVAANLKKAANNIYEVSDIVRRTGDELDNTVNPEVNRLFANIQRRVCDGCQLKKGCWSKHFNSTASDILSLCGVDAPPKGKLSVEKRCIRKDRLCSFVASSRREYIESISTKMKIREMRRVLTDQFSGMGDFLSEIAEKTSESRMIDTARSNTMRITLQDSGIDIDALSYFTNSSGAVTVEITLLGKTFEDSEKKVKTIIELMTKRFFCDAETRTSELRTLIIYKERLPFDVQIGFSQKPVKEGSVCGDTIGIADNGSNTCCALLSDGMGTGKKASVDSTMTVAVMEKLLSSGFSYDSSLKIVNSALIAKSTDESISTIDGVEINLFTGQIDFYKAGAAISLVRKGNQVITVEKSSLPLGILRNISFAKESVSLDIGDIVLLLSDGVTSGDCGWISDELLSWSTNSMEDLAKHIVKLCSLRTEKNLSDDMTVVALKLIGNKQKKKL